MKIDIHTHTKKCKSGDAPTREISPESFCETILSSEVKIVAITNHNVFDLTQYQAIASRMGQDAQVWPGIELDIQEDASRGHLLVLVSPTRVKDFSDLVDKLTEESTADSFTTTIDQVLTAFDDLSPLYIAHYKQKRPGLSDAAVEKLQRATKNPHCVLKEVTNAISAGVYISHGHASIYGSDVHDWTEYPKLSRQLPELRLDVDSFEHFCLLLKKDVATINTLLEKKTSEELILRPFDDDTTIKLKVFNDIHVVFGDKGTGKSCILKEIAKQYLDNGVDARVYQPASGGLEAIFDTKGKDLTIDLDTHGIEFRSAEIEVLRNACEIDITSPTRYVAHFKAKSTNKNAKQILLKELDPEEQGPLRREFLDFHDAADTTAAYVNFLSRNPAINKEVDKAELAEVIRILSALLERLRSREWAGFRGWKEISLLNSAIETFRKEVMRKTGTPARPLTTGFRDYAMNRVNIELNAGRILKSVSTAILPTSEVVGNLGPNKGVLRCQTELMFHDGTITDGAFLSLAKIKKTSMKDFINCVKQIAAHAYSEEVFEHISDLNDVEDVQHIKSVRELLLFKRYFALGGRPYSPSSGEASMVMLQKELEEDIDVYILDEPEKSLANEYINDVIVPLIKARAREGKKIFIATHNANIAVRTLPYSSIYRCHGKEGYSTYIGNPFSNNLLNPEAVGDQRDWKKVSMKTLEGGEEAFGERGIIYGND